jgi:hypothetical protein
MASIRKNPKFPDLYNVIENGVKVLGGRSFSKKDAQVIAAARTRLKAKKTAMAKKTTAKKKTPAKKKASGGIAGFVKKIQNTPAVKKVATTIKALEKKLLDAKKKKAAAVKIARKKLK